LLRQYLGLKRDERNEVGGGGCRPLIRVVLLVARGVASLPVRRSVGQSLPRLVCGVLWPGVGCELIGCC
jgi:hypothetical protein